MLHEGQFRISEEPYIIHPVEVAKILVDLKVDTHTLIAAFLHDILEDTDTKPEEIKELFGDDVLNLVKRGIDAVGKENMILDPDCGLRKASVNVACKKLETMTKVLNEVK